MSATLNIWIVKIEHFLILYKEIMVHFIEC